MRLTVDLTDAEVRAAEGLRITSMSYHFATGLVVLRDDTLSWRPNMGDLLLANIQGLDSFRKEGSGAQTLYGKVLRSHSHHVN